MSYQEEEQVSLRRRGSKQAIALAMQGRWREAVAANKSLIESFPNDVDAYNRLGRAYMELESILRQGKPTAELWNLTLIIPLPRRIFIVYLI